MIVQCAWCKKLIGEKPPYEDKSVTHTICPKCTEENFPDKGGKRMPTYYVTTPSSSLTAEVEAPDSRHARTAYLDYLSRNGLISWGSRQAIRRQIMTKRMQSGDIQTTVKLSYGVQEPQAETIPSPTLQLGRTATQVLEEERRWTEAAEAAERAEAAEPAQPKALLSGSPIANLSRQSKGV